MRLVITGFDAEDRSTVSSDSEVPPTQRVLWTTDPLTAQPRPAIAVTPQTLQVRLPAGVGDPTFPQPGASRFAVAHIPPDSLARAELGSAFDEQEFGMHQTQTIDYVTIVFGELTLRLDTIDVALHAGDCVVQRGTRHAWRNFSDEMCIFVATVLGAFPTPAPEQYA